VEETQIWLKSNKNIGHFTRRLGHVYVVDRSNKQTSSLPTAAQYLIPEYKALLYVVDTVHSHHQGTAILALNI